MSGIAVPQVQVFQQRTATSEERIDPLRAFIVGPEYDLHRYGVTGEGGFSLGDVADFSDPVEFNWLSDVGRQAGAVVDLNYSKVFASDALLQYFESTNADEVWQVTSLNGNKIRQTGGTPKVLVEANGSNLSAVFFGRNVRVGDHVYIHNPETDTEVNAKITGFEAEVVAAQSEYGGPHSGNAETSDGSNTDVEADGDNQGTATVSTPIGYNGLVSGELQVVYRITCTTADAIVANVRFSVECISGSDTTQTNVAVSGGSIPVGTRGGSVTVGNASLAFQGDFWDVTFDQEYDAPETADVEVTGTYTGPTDTSYIITVLKGGNTTAVSAADRPLLRVTTSTGIDGRAQFTYSGGVFSLGKFGLNLEIDVEEFVTGDIFYVNATAQSAGPIYTLVINKMLPSNLFDLTGSLTVRLSIVADIEIHPNLALIGHTNWSQTSSGITIEDSLREYVNEWRDGEESLPVVGGALFLTWRELLTQQANIVRSVSTVADIDSVFSTPNDPDNPLVYAAFRSILNSGSENVAGTGIRVASVQSDDVAGYTAALAVSEANDGLYVVVPLTHDHDVQNLVAAHVQLQSSPEIGQWRSAFLASELPSSLPIATSAQNNSNDFLATSAASLFTLEFGQANLVDLGVRAGDILRVNFQEDKYGNSVWDEYIIDSVTDSSVTTTNAPGSNFEVPTKIEIYRNGTAEDEVDYYIGLTSNFNSMRVCHIFPGAMPSGGIVVPSYHLCAALAGIVGALPPQQSLTNVEIRGFDNANHVLNRYSRTQLDKLANAGVWVVTQDPATNRVYTRHQLTTDTSLVSTREFSMVKNVDSVSYVFRNRLKGFIDRANVTQTAITVIETTINQTIAFLQSAGTDDLLGGQLGAEAELLEIRRHSVLPSRLVIKLAGDFPVPLNNIDLILVI